MMSLSLLNKKHVCLALVACCLLVATVTAGGLTEEEKIARAKPPPGVEEHEISRGHGKDWYHHAAAPNKTKHWYDPKHKAEDGWQEETNEANWAHKNHGFSIIAGGGFHHHMVEDPHHAHVLSQFHPIKMETHWVGEPGEPGAKLYFSHDGHKISPWHDIPLIAGRSREYKWLYHFMCEIPKGTTAKYEINKEAQWNPIVQDLNKDGTLRHYKYQPDKGSLVNYGALMQTWEDPAYKHPDTGVGGDNDPIDVLQLNERPCKVGELQPVRLLGTLALVDGDETDWKLIVVDNTDRKTEKMKDIGDVPKERIDELREWFRMYKTAEGKPENKFGLEEKAMDAAYADKVVRETHKAWKLLVHDHHGTEL